MQALSSSSPHAKQFGAALSTGGVAEKFKGTCYTVFDCGNKQWGGAYQKFAKAIYLALGAVGGTPLCDMGAGDADAGTIKTDFSRWSLACLISIMQNKDIPLPASLNEQLYEKITPLEAFVWEGKEASACP